jgi:hypothetical protein
MAKAKPTDETAQAVLVPMTDEELKAAGHKLAAKQGELEDLKARHSEEKSEMRAAEKRLAGEVSAIASTIRTQGR